jgi:hypothetical protein
MEKLKAVPVQKRLIWMLENARSYEGSIEDKVELFNAFDRLFKLIDKEKKMHLN